jgi:hypothetical protein
MLLFVLPIYISMTIGGNMSFPPIQWQNNASSTNTNGGNKINKSAKKG